MPHVLVEIGCHPIRGARLLADAQSLAQYGPVDGGQLAELKGANGSKNVVQDLQIVRVYLGTMRVSGTPERGAAWPR